MALVQDDALPESGLFDIWNVGLVDQGLVYWKYSG